MPLVAKAHACQFAWHLPLPQGAKAIQSPCEFSGSPARRAFALEQSLALRALSEEVKGFPAAKSCPESMKLFVGLSSTAVADTIGTDDTAPLKHLQRGVLAGTGRGLCLCCAAATGRGIMMCVPAGLFPATTEAQR